MSITQDQVTEAAKSMEMSDDLRSVFVGGFNFALEQASQLEPDKPLEENIYSFLAVGIYGISKRFGVQSGNQVMTQFGKFMKALFPDEVQGEFRTRVTNYFAKSFRITMAE